MRYLTILFILGFAPLALAEEDPIDEEIVETEAGDSPSTLADDIEEAIEEEVDMQAADGGWMSLTKTGAKIRLYGFVRLDAYYNSARFNNVHTPVRVLPEDNATAKPNDNEFAFDARLTRIGIDFKGIECASADVTGKIELDFGNFNAVESRATPRIRQAWLQIANAGWKVRLGQDWDVISPLYPSVNAQTLMWNAGNLGDRRPQAQFIFSGGGDGAVSWVFEFSFGLTGAIDGANVDAGNGTGVTSAQFDGFDSGVPHLQARKALTVRVGGRDLTFGIWGVLGQLETDDRYPLVGGASSPAGDRSFTIAGFGIDVTIPMGNKVTLQGEGWVGQAMGDMRGGIGQSVNLAKFDGTANGTADEIAASGGWIELQVRPGKWQFHIGGTVDDPDNGDVAVGGQILNVSGYVGMRRWWGKNLVTGLDVTFWETANQTAGAGDSIGNAVRVDLFTQLDF